VPITATIPTQAKADFLAGLHVAGNAYKMALYPNTATLDATTATYSSTGECPNGSGYATGGVALSGFSTGTNGTQGNLSFTSPTWPTSTITARGAVIYDTTQANKVIAVLSFGASDITSTAATFTVNLPAAGATGGCIQFN
jgi:hypothetical protein